jgi:hypothetical protein
MRMIPALIGVTLCGIGMLSAPGPAWAMPNCVYLPTMTSCIRDDGSKTTTTQIGTSSYTSTYDARTGQATNQSTLNFGYGTPYAPGYGYGGGGVIGAPYAGGAALAPGYGGAAVTSARPPVYLGRY